MVWYLICNDCGAVMENEEAAVRIIEPHSELDGCPVEILYENHCICCGSTDLDEAAECSVCGEMVSVGDLDEDDVCSICRGECDGEDKSYS